MNDTVGTGSLQCGRWLQFVDRLNVDYVVCAQDCSYSFALYLHHCLRPHCLLNFLSLGEVIRPTASSSLIPFRDIFYFLIILLVLGLVATRKMLLRSCGLLLALASNLPAIVAFDFVNPASHGGQTSFAQNSVYPEKSILEIQWTEPETWEDATVALYQIDITKSSATDVSPATIGDLEYIAGESRSDLMGTSNSKYIDMLSHSQRDRLGTEHHGGG